MRKYILWAFLVIVLLFIVPALFAFFKNFVVNYLWFQSIGYLSRFLLVFKVKIVTFITFFVCSFIFILLNHFMALYNVKSYAKKFNISSDIWLFGRKISLIFIVLFSIIFGLSSTYWWADILNFINAIKFNASDPIFNKDIGFYVFKFNLYKLVRSWSLYMLFLLFIWSGFFYFFTGAISQQRLRFFVPKKARWHFGILLFLIFINFSISVLFKKFEILFSQGTIVKGASYTDIYAHMFAYNLLIIAFIITGMLFIYWIFNNKFKYPLIGIAALIGITIIFSGIYPFILQQLIVSPNEIEKERPFIKNTIKYTRKAYGLDKVKVINFDVKNDLHTKELDKNIVNNIRLWDWRPLKSTFKQLQEIRPYYIFSDVDIDRYIINGRLRQVMLSAREISHRILPREAQNWINRYLKYTHGHGIVMMPVNIKNEEGLPVFFIKDIPPVSEIDIEIKQPEIYYGETVRDYVIVNTKTKEFDYPSGDGNVYSTYKGSGGILINKFWKKIIMAMELSDIKMLFSSLITKNTRVMIRRYIIEIVKRLVPFLMIDNDPYMVVVDGRLYWFIDAYTYTDKYPYSELHGENFNYIRNSVKIIIDAYTGEVNLYIVDKNDPIVRVYKKIFPGLFKDASALPEEFKTHFRYPDDLFMVQSEIYRTYHMTDPEVFYNKEDLWDIPLEVYDDKEILMNSYFIINKLKGEEEVEFLNMMPFTPTKKDNMIGMLMARCDIPHYGELVAYKLPKKKLTYGPLQIESLIDQNVEISKLVTLWGQKGSRVIRGNIFVVPIEDSIIYVEPLYLQAERKELPELKRIIVVYNNNIAISPSLTEALDMVIQGRSSSIKMSDAMFEDLLDRLSNAVRNAEKSLEDKNYKAGARHIKKLKEIIKEHE